MSIQEEVTGPEHTRYHPCLHAAQTPAANPTNRSHSSRPTAK